MEKEKIKKIIEEYELESSWNPKTKSLGLRSRSDIKFSELQKNTELLSELQRSREEIILFIKEKNNNEKIEKEKKEKIEEKKEKEEMIKNNREITIGLHFSFGENVWGLPSFLREKEESIKKMNIISSHGSDGEWTLKIKVNELIKKIENFEKKENERIEMKENERIEKEEKIFETAKRTNEKQILYQYSIECRDKKEECNIDNVVVYAMPDGTTKKEIYHTW